MRVDNWRLPDEHHAISLRAKARWEKNGKLSAKDLAAIEAEYGALLEGDFDELRDAAASLTTLMFYIRGANDMVSADALHEVILMARPRFDRWRAERQQGEDGAEKVEKSTAPRVAPMFGAKAAIGSISLKTLKPNIGLDRARQLSVPREGPPSLRQTRSHETGSRLPTTRAR